MPQGVGADYVKKNTPPDSHANFSWKAEKMLFRITHNVVAKGNPALIDQSSKNESEFEVLQGAGENAKDEQMNKKANLRKKSMN
jgi:hypothetical protein